jgi:hypothetical protein
MEILFSIALGLNPRQLKKDWNGKQPFDCAQDDDGNQESPIPKLRDFAPNKKNKNHTFYD